MAKQAIDWAAMPETTPTEEWAKYVNIARRIAVNFARQYGRPCDEWVDIAEYALALELFGRRGFESKRGVKKSTWLYTVVYFHCKQVITRGEHPCPGYEGSLKVKVRQWSREIPFTELSGDGTFVPDPAAVPTRIAAMLTELSQEAQALVAIVLEAPKELAYALAPGYVKRHGKRAAVLKTLHPTKTRKAKNMIQSYLIDELDWSRSKVDKVWEEVQEVMA